MDTHIYLFTDTQTNLRRLIRASNQYQAVLHTSKKTHFDIKVANKDELMDMISIGVTVEVAEPVLSNRRFN